MKPCSIAGTLLILSGLACLGGAGLVTHDALDAEKRAAEQFEIADKQCRAQLDDLGRVTENGAHLEVTIPVTDPRQALGDATAAAAVCPLRTLSALCIGTVCDQGRDEGKRSGPGRLVMNIRLTGF